MSQFDRLFDRKAGNARKWADQVLAEKFGLTANAIPWTWPIWTSRLPRRFTKPS